MKKLHSNVTITVNGPNKVTKEDVIKNKDKTLKMVKANWHHKKNRVELIKGKTVKVNDAVLEWRAIKDLIAMGKVTVVAETKAEVKEAKKEEKQQKADEDKLPAQ
jgi:hypothetical protein